MPARSVVTSYPGVITDWGGTYLDRRILKHLRVGNIVRIPITQYSPDNKKSITQTAYFRIIKHCGGDKFRGIMEDPYYGEEEWFLVNNGEERLFASRHVTEIPLTWRGNQNLNKVAVFKQKGRTYTGAIM